MHLTGEVSQNMIDGQLVALVIYFLELVQVQDRSMITGYVVQILRFWIYWKRHTSRSGEIYTAFTYLQLKRWYKLNTNGLKLWILPFKTMITVWFNYSVLKANAKLTSISLLRKLYMNLSHMLFKITNLVFCLHSHNDTNKSETSTCRFTNICK